MDLAERLAEITKNRSHVADTSQGYVSTPLGSVHMHVVGFEQTVPLHIHRLTHEATLIVSGQAEVTQIFGREGQTARREGTYSPGTLIYSPPFCGHKWVNRAKTEMQANLVFAVPPFDGNFYVSEDDPRLLNGGEPFVYDPDEALKSILTDPGPRSPQRLPIMGGRMFSLLVPDHAYLEPDEQNIIVYVARGQGTLKSDREYEIRSRQLVAIRADSPVEIRAREGAPLALYIFKLAQQSGTE